MGPGHVWPWDTSGSVPPRGLLKGPPSSPEVSAPVPTWASSPPSLPSRPGPRPPRRSAPLPPPASLPRPHGNAEGGVDTSVYGAPRAGKTDSVRTAPPPQKSMRGPVRPNTAVTASSLFETLWGRMPPSGRDLMRSGAKRHVPSQKGRLERVSVQASPVTGSLCTSLSPPQGAGTGHGHRQADSFRVSQPGRNERGLHADRE